MSTKNASTPVLDLKRLLSMAWRGGALFGSMTLFVVLLLPNAYRSEARILPADAKNTLNLGSFGAAAAAIGMPLQLPGSGGDSANLDILRSQWMGESLLTHRFSYRTKGLWGWGNPSEGSLLEYYNSRNLDRGLAALREDFYAHRDPKTNLLTISMESRSPELSQAVVKEATRLLEEFTKQRSQTRGGAKAAFARSRLKDVEVEYTKAEEVFKAFLNRNRNYLSSSEPTVRLQGLRLEGEMQLRRQLVAAVSLSLEQALMEEKDDTPILNVLDAGNCPEDKSRPARASMVVLSASLGALAGVLWGLRSRLPSLLTDR